MRVSPRWKLPFQSVLIVLAISLPAVPQTEPAPVRETTRPDPAGTASLRLESHYAELPLAFEPNVGQTDPQVRFLTRSRGATVFFTDTETVMVLHAGGKRLADRTRRRNASSQTAQAVVRMKMVGAGKPLEAIGLEKLPGISNYFIGNDPKQWRTDVPNYARIRYRGIYPGVDLVCYGKARQLEYDLVVMPGADPQRIELAWEGVERLERNRDGDLVLLTGLGAVVQKRPRAYQESGGRRVEVAANYVIRADRHVTVDLPRYDRSLPLVIDPVVLVYSTFLGGGDNDGANSIAVDTAGAAYVASWTDSTDFPTGRLISPSRAAVGMWLSPSYRPAVMRSSIRLIWVAAARKCPRRSRSTAHSKPISPGLRTRPISRAVLPTKAVLRAVTTPSSPSCRQPAMR